MVGSNANDALVATLREAARRISAQRSIRDLRLALSSIVAAAVQTVPGAAAAGGISFVEGGVVTCQAPTDDDVAALDALPSRLHEGPWITATTNPPVTGVVLAGDLAGEDAARWPRFAPAAVERGYRAMMSTQLSTDGSQRGALNLYAHSPGVFDVDAQLTAGLFGIQAALVLYGAEHTASLNRALETRDVIGQAKGILAERFAVTDSEAFQMLVDSSQENNIKLVEVARWLIGDAADRRHDRSGRVRPQPDRDHPDPTAIGVDL